MYEKLPEQLKKVGRFCLWKYEERNGRMTKKLQFHSYHPWSVATSLSDGGG